MVNRPNIKTHHPFAIVFLLAVGMVGLRAEAERLEYGQETAAYLPLLVHGGDFKLLAPSDGVCEDWIQVNLRGFGLDSGDGYTNEEGFEVLVFDDQLYLGMEADDSLGARLWRTKRGLSAAGGNNDWQEVIADEGGLPFGVEEIAQVDHIDSLASFQGYLYASTANQGDTVLGARLFRSASGDPQTWEDALALTQIGAGFGDVYNTNFKDMQVFDGHLCGGTQNLETGAQVWCTPDGTSWTQKNNSGFGDKQSAAIWSGHVYDSALYFGVRDVGVDRLNNSGDDIARLFRTGDLDGSPTWEETYTGLPGSNRVDILGDLDGYLYIAARSEEGIVILRSPSGDPGSWVQVNQAGMDGNPENVGAVVDGASLHNGALYVGVSNLTAGFEVWRTSGVLQGETGLVDWRQLGPSGWGDPDNSHTELIPFNGYLYAWTSNFATGQQVLRTRCPAAKHTVLMIADGWGPNHTLAANSYTGTTPDYQSNWTSTCMATYPLGGSYDPVRAWSDFDYVLSGGTDSAAAATAMVTGVKTANLRVSASADDTIRLYTLSEKARDLDKAAGSVTSVFLSHATPGAWMAHNTRRWNGYAIADEGLWGDPNTTGTPLDSEWYRGGLGPTYPPLDVVMGAGHPAWFGGNYVNQTIRDKLVSEDGHPGAFAFVERVDGSPDGGERLLDAAQDPPTTRLAGLFGNSQGHLGYRYADGSGADPENPTLAEMTTAALLVLERDPQGFALMVEGGAVDWASHINHMDAMLGEMIGFNHAVQAVIDWVEDPANGSDWGNTLVIVTGDHETGYLTAAPGVFPNQPLGAVNETTLSLERTVSGTGLRASWEDADQDGAIDAGEKVYWAWNTTGHTNMLVPLYARGEGASLFQAYIAQSDPVCGTTVDNTAVFKVMDAVNQ